MVQIEEEQDEQDGSAQNCEACYHTIIKKSLSCWGCGFMYWGEGACRRCNYPLDSAWVKGWSQWTVRITADSHGWSEPMRLPDCLGDVRRNTAEEVGKMLLEKWEEVEDDSR